ncbi:hypothetical protein GCM10008983_05150 [Lentibacillus halophilus]|uniref:Glyoxalase-like domain-containing protein n=2 Tax=Lentibacillus halophilus TaxID=295065 RepID=A0ABP3IXK4_9BACI
MLALDHIIISAHNPEQAAQEFANKYGITVVQGSEHPNWGTYNYLAYFRNDCYIEWIGIADWAVANQSTNPLIQQLAGKLSNGTEGTIQYALRTDRMHAYIDHFHAQGIAYTGPFPGSRKRSDGQLLKWQMLFPSSESTENVWPFLIEWDDVKNTPPDENMINDQHISSLDAIINNPNEFAAIYQLPYTHQTARLENAELRFAEAWSFVLR